MEPKKNPKYDVHAKRNVIFNFSLAVSLLIVISAFRISVPYRDDVCTLSPPETLDVLVPDVPATKHPEKKPQPIVVQRRAVPVSEIRNIRVAERYEAANDSVVVAFNDVDVPVFAGITLPPEPLVDTLFRVVENPPVPIGGYPAFYKTLRDNIKYPRKASQLGITGRVFVEFTVDRSGEPKDVRVLKGIGAGCDEEAMRVIGLTRWTAGKQRGKPVRVRMVLPVVFEMHH